jgi:hypothetical protein
MALLSCLLNIIGANIFSKSFEQTSSQNHGGKHSTLLGQISSQNHWGKNLLNIIGQTSAQNHWGKHLLKIIATNIFSKSLGQTLYQRYSLPVQ